MSPGNDCSANASASMFNRKYPNIDVKLASVMLVSPPSNAYPKYTPAIPAISGVNPAEDDINSVVATDIWSK